jgi:hypothetical protein
LITIENNPIRGEEAEVAAEVSATKGWLCGLDRLSLLKACLIIPSVVFLI